MVTGRSPTVGVSLALWFSFFLFSFTSVSASSRLTRLFSADTVENDFHGHRLHDSQPPRSHGSLPGSYGPPSGHKHFNNPNLRRPEPVFDDARRAQAMAGAHQHHVESSRPNAAVSDPNAGMIQHASDLLGSRLGLSEEEKNSFYDAHRIGADAHFRFGQSLGNHLTSKNRQMGLISNDDGGPGGAYASNRREPKLNALKRDGMPDIEAIKGNVDNINARIQDMLNPDPRNRKYDRKEIKWMRERINKLKKVKAKEKAGYHDFGPEKYHTGIDSSLYDSPQERKHKAEIAKEMQQIIHQRSQAQ